MLFCSKRISVSFSNCVQEINCRIKARSIDYKTMAVLAWLLFPFSGFASLVNFNCQKGNVLVRISPVATGGFVPQAKLQAPPNWTMKHCKLVEFLSNLNVKTHCTKVKPPVDDFLATVYIRGGQPAARVNIWYGPHQNFRYSIQNTKSCQHEEAPW